MKTFLDKTQENKKQTKAHDVFQNQNSDVSSLRFVDNRPEAVQAKKLQRMMDNSPKVEQLNAVRKMANNSPRAKQLKAIRALSDSGTGAQRAVQLRAMSREHAQQKQGGIKSAIQLKKNVNVNDDVGLEKEADVMGTKAAVQTNSTYAGKPQLQGKIAGGSGAPVQRMVEPGLPWYTIVKVNTGYNKDQLVRILLPYTNPGNPDKKGYFTSDLKTRFQTSYLYADLDPVVIPDFAKKMAQDTYKVAIVGEEHNLLSKEKEQNFWDSFGVKVIYESGEIPLGTFSSPKSSVKPDPDALRIFSMWQDIQERMALLKTAFRLDKLQGKSPDQDLKAAEILKENILKFFSYCKEILVFDVPEAAGFMHKLGEFKDILPPLFGNTEDMINTKSIDVAQLHKIVLVLEKFTAIPEEESDAWADAIGTLGLKGKSYNNLTQLRSLEMFQNVLKNAENMDRIIYKVGEKHLQDMLLMADSMGLGSANVKLVPMGTYMSEIGSLLL